MSTLDLPVSDIVTGTSLVNVLSSARRSLSTSEGAVVTLGGGAVVSGAFKTGAEAGGLVVVARGGGRLLRLWAVMNWVVED